MERGLDREQPHGPAAEHGDVVARVDLGEIRAEVAGGEDVGDEDRLVIADLLGKLHHADVRQRDPGQFRLQPVKRPGRLGPAEERGAGLLAVGVGVVALGVVAGPAIRAIAACNSRRDHDPVADLEVADLLAQLLDDAHALMPEDRAGLHAGHGSPDHVQVGAADRAGGQPHDRVGGLLDLGLGNAVEPDIPDGVKNHGIHGDLFSLLRVE